MIVLRVEKKGVVWHELYLSSSDWEKVGWYFKRYEMKYLSAKDIEHDANIWHIEYAERDLYIVAEIIQAAVESWSTPVLICGLIIPEEWQIEENEKVICDIEIKDVEIDEDNTAIALSRDHPYHDLIHKPTKII